MKFINFDQSMMTELGGIPTYKPEQYYDLIHGPVREADAVLFPAYWQVNSLVFGLHKNIFPSLSNYLLGHNKVEMTRAFQAIVPSHVPDTLILPNTPSAQEQILDEFFFPFVAKEIRSARGCGVFLIENAEDFARYAANNDVLYVQMYLPITRDMRIVWVGDRVVAAYWREAEPGKFLNNVFQGGSVRFDAVPDGAIELVTQTARTLGVNFAGFDVADVDGEFSLFEFNNRFGNQALCDSGITLGSAVLEYLTR